MGEPRIGVLGAGSIGCFCGGRLAALDADVVMVGRQRVRDELSTSGLTTEDMEGTSRKVPPERVWFSTDPGVLEDRDVVFVCTKSAQTGEAGAALAKAFEGRRRVVVSLQNGVGNADVLRQRLPDHEVLGGIVGFNVVSLGGGRFRRATTGPLVIERSRDPRARAAARMLSRAGFDVRQPRDVRPLQWSKLVMNLANAVSALSGEPTQRILSDGGYRRIVRAIMAEALEVMAAAGVRTARLGPLPVRLFPAILALPTPAFRAVARAQLAIDPEARSSMWEDLDKRRLTEVDWLNGEIVRLAERCGRRAPIAARVVELVHEVEAARAGSPRLAADDLARALGVP